jgi:hypothetical protein
MDVSQMEGDHMADTIWTWATLDSHGIEVVEEAERTLGADFVLAYTAGEPRTDLPALLPMVAAPLDESQIECLRGVEAQLGVVAVAYRLTV